MQITLSTITVFFFSQSPIFKNLWNKIERKKNIDMTFIWSWTNNCVRVFLYIFINDYRKCTIKNNRRFALPREITFYSIVSYAKSCDTNFIKIFSILRYLRLESNTFEFLLLIQLFMYKKTCWVWLVICFVKCPPKCSIMSWYLNLEIKYILALVDLIDLCLKKPSPRDV